MSKRRKEKALNVITVLLLLVALGSGATLAVKLFAQSKNTAGLESLAEVVNREAPYVEIRQAKEQGDETTETLRRRRLDGYAELNRQNPDMVGWLGVPNTRIDYPVMQSVDSPDFYLKHNFEKESSSYGVPYVAEGCDLKEGCDNMVVYGHHMKDGSMFTDLMKYEQQSFFEQNPIIYFDTLEEMGEYQIIGVLAVPAVRGEAEFYNKMEAATPYDYSSYVAEVKRRSHYETGEMAVYPEQLLTLITCEYTVEEGRFIIVAKKIN